MSSIASKTYESVAPMKVAFLGLGVMGFPMAGHLARAGHPVTVYNRSPAKAQAWMAEFGGSAKATPREAAMGADIVFSCVGNDDDLRAVTLGADGAFAGMAPGSVLVDHTTASADVARELYGAAKNLGLAFVDAPVSGGQAGAQNGLLTVMCGGDAAAFHRFKDRDRVGEIVVADGVEVPHTLVHGQVLAPPVGIAFEGNAAPRVDLADAIGATAQWGFIAAAIGEEKDTIEDVIEPFLIQQGFIQRTPRGRIASPRAYQHIGFDLPQTD